jgi:hypothetical protein
MNYNNSVGKSLKDPESIKKALDRGRSNRITYKPLKTKPMEL